MSKPAIIEYEEEGKNTAPPWNNGSTTDTDLPERSEQKKIIVPDNLKSFLSVESCENFPIKRYVLTTEQKEIYESIVTARKIAPKMKGLGIPYLNSVLLYGVPGTGKTTFGRYVAYKQNLQFAFMNFANLVGGIMGDTARNIHDVFTFMTSQKCVFMMDELDCVSVDRTQESSATGGELSRITITVMQELDHYKSAGMESVIIAATNVIEKIDPAMRSRFAIKKEIVAWNNEYKEKYARRYLESIPIPYDPDNIHDYCVRHSDIQQREIEADITRGIAKWIEKGGLEGRDVPFVLQHISEYEGG